MNKTRFLFLTAITLAAVAARLLPHPPNFSPVAALALFAGASFASKRAALLVPLVALFLSDLVIGFYPLAPVVYSSFALVACLGFWLRRRRSTRFIAVTAVAGAVMFFALTNFGVWAFGSWYAMTSAGLVACFVAAIPFFRNALASDLVFTALLFSILALAQRRWPILADVSAAAAS
jgi:hypothetical protein